MGSGTGDHRRARTTRAADMLKGRGLQRLARRRARYERLRLILSEKLGKLVGPDGYELDLDGERRLVLLAASNAHAELLRQTEPDIREAVAAEGVDEVRIRVSFPA